MADSDIDAPEAIVNGLIAAILKATAEDWQIDVNFTPKQA